MKAEDEISPAFSLCNPQCLLGVDERYLRSLQMDDFPELELLYHLVVWGGI